MSEPLLKHCPFCGLTDLDTISPDMGETPAVSLHSYPGGFRVECEGCGTNGPWHHDHQAALSAWDSRHNDADQLIQCLESMGLGWSLDHAGHMIEARIWDWPNVIGRYRPATVEPLANMLRGAMAGMEKQPHIHEWEDGMQVTTPYKQWRLQFCKSSKCRENRVKPGSMKDVVQTPVIESANDAKYESKL